ncbi:hypothetical protein ACFQJD_18615 [Haloplanus sp. GCM10025708]|uniref:hypothetical protein n=1 Tax=Haloplanus sp. GCM10025708 TaxID=3252679 RepID=UPI00361EAAA3
MKTRWQVDGHEYGKLVDVTSRAGLIPVEIALRSPLNKDGDFTPVFRGWVGGIGGGEDSVQFTVNDVADVLEEIPASRRFTNPSPEIPLEYIASELEDAGVFPEVNVVGVESAAENQSYTSLNAASDVQSIDPEMGSLGRREFTRNRSTLLDVLRWIRNRGGPYRYWLRPSEDFETLEIVVAHINSLPEIGSEYDATGDGDVALLKNRALYQTQLRNSVVAVGAAKKSRSAQPLDSQWTAESAPSRYVRVRAVYDDLVQRAGGEYASRQIQVDSASEREVKAAARSYLADLLSDSDGGGWMYSVLAPQLGPYDRIRALPADQAVIDVDAEPLTWSINSVVHRTDPEYEIPNTKLDVNFHVDESEIKISDVVWEDA